MIAKQIIFAWLSYIKLSIKSMKLLPQSGGNMANVDYSCTFIAQLGFVYRVIIAVNHLQRASSAPSLCHLRIPVNEVKIQDM